MADQDKSKKTDNTSSNEEQRSESKGNSNQPPETGSDTPLLEWLLAIIGLALVVFSVGFLVYQAVTGDEAPPDVTVEMNTITPTSHGYLVQFRAINQGETTAKGLIIEGQLTDAGQEIEKSETSLDYIPAGSEREGGLFFTENPDQFEMQLRALGYEQP
jgi:uncharacterized protein (TIGR02588 family)